MNVLARSEPRWGRDRGPRRIAAACSPSACARPGCGGSPGWRLAGVTVAYPELRSPDRDVRCHYLNARLQTGDQEALVVPGRCGTKVSRRSKPASPDQRTGNRRQDRQRRYLVADPASHGRAPTRRAPQPEGVAAGRRGAGRGDMERMLAGRKAISIGCRSIFAITRGGREMAIAAMVRIAVRGCAGCLCAPDAAQRPLQCRGARLRIRSSAGWAPSNTCCRRPSGSGPRARCR